VLRPGATVQIYEGSLPVWFGFLAEPSSDGRMEAVGAWVRGAGVLALDALGLPTSSPQAVVGAGIARGALPWKQEGVFLSPTAIGELGSAVTVNEVLDRRWEFEGVPWGVNQYGQVRENPRPTAPTWMTFTASDVWSVSSDKYASHLNVHYATGEETFADFLYAAPNADAAIAKWGRVEQPFDLSELGVITQADAIRYAESAFAQLAPKMQLTDALTLGPGQLRTMGDTAAGWSAVHAGQAVRLLGVPDKSATSIVLHTDMVIGTLERSATQLTLTPAGMPPNNTRDVIAAMSA